MKSTFLTFIYVFVTSISFAQHSDSLLKKDKKWCYSINGGVGFSELTKQSYGALIGDTKALIGSMIDQSVNRSLSKNFHIGIGLGYLNPRFQRTNFYGTPVSWELKFKCLTTPVYLKVVSYKLKFLNPFVSIGYMPCFVINANFKRYFNGQMDREVSLPFSTYCSFIFTSLGIQKSLNKKFDLKIEMRYIHTHKPFVYKYENTSMPETITEQYSFKIFSGLIGFNYKF
ncbi:MAG: outer membrane protein beta-barrel domain [Bacteroidota bacterium]